MKVSLFTWDQSTSCGIKFAKELLESRHDVVGIFARPPREKGELNLSRKEKELVEYYQNFLKERGTKDLLLGEYPTLKHLQRAYDFTLYGFAKHNSDECEGAVSSLGLDLIVISGDGVLKSYIYSRAKYGAVNFHTGIVPHYRGNSTLYWALRNMELNMVGYTVHRVEDTVDAGDIIYQEIVPIRTNDSERTILERCEDLGSKKIVEIVDLIEVLGNDIPTTKQDLSIGKEYRGVPTPKGWYDLAKLMETKEWQERMVRE